MRVTCPTCAAGYEVPDRLLAAGPKMLRCAKCGTTFPAERPTPAIAVPAEITPVAAVPALRPASPMIPVPDPQAVRVVFHPPMLESPRLRPRSVGAVWGFAGWVATLVVIAGAGYVLTHDAGKIVAAWPPAARAYAAVGLSPAAIPPPTARRAAVAGPANSPLPTQAPQSP